MYSERVHAVERGSEPTSATDTRLPFLKLKACAICDERETCLGVNILATKRFLAMNHLNAGYLREDFIINFLGNKVIASFRFYW